MVLRLCSAAARPLLRRNCRRALSASASESHHPPPDYGDVSLERHLEIDRTHLWHPYTSMTAPLPVYPVARAEGCRIELETGASLVDGMSSWWCAIHGYNHPALNAAVTDQLEDMSHVMFGGLTLASKLVELSPPGINKVFLCDSGSVSVEVAIKMAVQYWHQKDLPGKKKLLTLRGGYHGDTFGAMAICDPANGMHAQLFEGALIEHFFAPTPAPDRSWSLKSWDGVGAGGGSGGGGGADGGDDCVAGAKALLETKGDQIAALIVEPLVQGAGGMRFYSPETLRALRALCDEHGVLMILDEIATGFGRTGSMFACDRAGVVPDIMCVGKALTGGYMTMGATLATDEVGEGVSSGGGVFMHGPTFMGNPLACAVAGASLDLLASGAWRERVCNIHGWLEAGLAPCVTPAGDPHGLVEDVRVFGAIGVVELKRPVRDMAALQAEFVARGVWIRPFGKLVYLMPPFVMSEAELGELTTAICGVVREGLV